jgi:hypothetical protein
MHPPDFHNDWIAPLMLYNYGLFLGLLRINYIAACRRADRGLGLKEWVRK